MDAMMVFDKGEAKSVELVEMTDYMQIHVQGKARISAYRRLLNNGDTAKAKDATMDLTLTYEEAEVLLGDLQKIVELRSTWATKAGDAGGHEATAPIPMLLWCPACHARHIDEALPQKGSEAPTFEAGDF